MSRMIQISELTFAARDRRRILENLTLTLERGEVAGIVGESGSGKTLLVELIQGAVRPQSGQILVNDRNVTRLSAGKLRLLRQSLGVVPQQPVWPKQLTVEECLQFKLSWMGLTGRQVDRKTDEVVQTLALNSLRAQRFGDIPLGDRFTAYLALALCHDPVLLLCDGLFDGPEEDGGQALSVVLSRAQQLRNLTVLLTGQAPGPFRQLAGRILHLRGGALLEAQATP